MRKIVVHDEDGTAMCVTCGRLFDAKVVEASVVPLHEMLLGDDVRTPRLDMTGAWAAWL
jgi:hypothetical protein